MEEKNLQAEENGCDVKTTAEENTNTEKETLPGGYTPKTDYERVLLRVYEDRRTATVLKVASLSIVAVTVLAFIVRLLELFVSDHLLLLETLIITGVPFIALSVMRVLVDAPRPYELLPFYEKRPKGKCGRSFPSRHVFSVFVIGAVIMPSSILLGSMLLVLGACLAIFRVLLGIHFIRDVVAGALMGAVSGAVGLLAIAFI